MAQILNGNFISKQLKEEIKQEVAQWTAKGYRPPHLAAVLVGENGASVTYVNNKIKDCHAVGFKSSLVKLDDSVTEQELIGEIKKLNADTELDGFIVQLPLPKHIDQERVILAIDPSKDVDGFHPENFGKMALDMESFLSATPFGIITLLERYNISTEGKDVVVVGRSRIVGKPMSLLMGRKGYPGNSTVTTVHTHTRNLEEYTRRADIVITALGVPHFLKADMIKVGAVVVDVGITRVEDASKEKGFYLAGDVDFEEVEKKAAWITPVPGGVGPMTRAMLLKNSMLAYTRRFKSVEGGVKV
ncbi:MAG: bifunctional 5,10-methylenetetrahydrofolate dehydrogenase/5,10-methenyltetrahydrofolate cyclohydrolase [Flavobacteriaceae bacterium]|nr:bifunctional 5,10-methylenetetrahydrofolate dehydrogenase/5,10-methenyltetrahydrofolate cyclohydrolase [Flavobacteriaceae bacterium]